MLTSRNSPESGDPLIVMKLWLIVSGIYIWEFVTTLDFEWNFIRRHQRYLWTVWIYSISRLSGLAVIIIIFINFYGTSPINCQAWVTSGWTFAILGYSLSSILIMLRIMLMEIFSFAIWDRSKIIMAISAAIWLINLGFQLSGIIKIRAAWVPAAKSCAITNVESCRSVYISQLVTDAVLLVIMLAGLLRLRRGTRGSLYLSHLLWKQGLIWLVIATAAELPQVFLLFLHVNDSLNSLFMIPSMVTIILAATRTYRSLIQSASTPDSHIVEPDSPNLQIPTRHLVSRTTNETAVVHIPSNRLEVMVHTSYNHGEYPMSQTDHYGLSPDKPHDLDLDDNVEDRDGKK